MEKYTVNDNIVRCIIVTKVPTWWRLETRTFIGIAKCSPEDKFDIEKGKEIAHKRALLKLKKCVLEHSVDEMKHVEKEHLHYIKHCDVKIRTELQIARLKEELHELY